MTSPPKLTNCWPLLATLTLAIAFLASVTHNGAESKEYKKEHQPQSSRGGLCIARFESTTGEPLYYTCPRPNESEKKKYCCYLDKCCDFKEFQKTTEQQFKMTQGLNHGYIAKNAIGGTLKVLLWVVCGIILIIVLSCCLTLFLCRKKKLFQGNNGLFSSPLPAHPNGPSPYARPANPYVAYEWPPETNPHPSAPPQYKY